MVSRRVDIELGLKEARLLGGGLLALEVSRGLPGDFSPSCDSWLAVNVEEVEVLAPAPTAVHAGTVWSHTIPVVMVSVRTHTL